MVGQILEARLNAPVVFADDEYECVGGANVGGERFHRGRGSALFIFLVHPIEHRQADRLGIDQDGVVAARAQALEDVIGQANSSAVGAVRAIDDENF